MINKFYSFMTLIFSLIVFQSCDDGWDFDTPGCMDANAENYDSNATFDNGSCYSISDIFTINSSSYDDWIYYSFELEDVIDIVDPQNSLDWDIAFRRNHIRTNGGLSGMGGGCAIVDVSQPWTHESFSLSEQIPDYECEVDEVIEGNIFTYEGCYNPDTHLFESCIKNPVLDNWGSFNDSYQFNVDNYQFFVKSANGTYIKFWPMSYYDVNGESGYITILHQVISVY